MITDREKIDAYDNICDQLGIDPADTDPQEVVDEVYRLHVHLPRCWRLDGDGQLVQDVLVTPGMTVYEPSFCWPDQVYGWTAEISAGPDGGTLVEDCGSTPEAAKALKLHERENTNSKEAR
ncbi:MAG: hypothetical protein ACLFVH_13185 [Phycisphaerae bacterium]